MEIGRHVEEADNLNMTIQSLQMPWNNVSSRQTSRQGSLDPQGRPMSRDSMRSGALGAGVTRSSLRGGDVGRGTPVQRRDTPATERAGDGMFVTFVC
jgi:hypothetical protein